MARNCLVYKVIYPLTEKALIKYICSALLPFDCDGLNIESEEKCKFKRTFLVIQYFLTHLSWTLVIFCGLP